MPKKLHSKCEMMRLFFNLGLRGSYRLNWCRPLMDPLPPSISSPYKYPSTWGSRPLLNVEQRDILRAGLAHESPDCSHGVFSNVFHFWPQMTQCSETATRHGRNFQQNVFHPLVFRFTLLTQSATLWLTVRKSQYLVSRPTIFLVSYLLKRY